MSFDGRRRRYVPVDVHVAFGKFGTKLVDRWGTEGVGTWVLFLAACKRELVEGTLTYTTEDDGWSKLGAKATTFSLDEFWKFTGQQKKTSRIRHGRLSYVTCTVWNEWNTPRGSGQNPSKKGGKAGEKPQDAPDYNGDTTPKSKASKESDLELQSNGVAGFTIPKNASALGDLAQAIRNRSELTMPMLEQFARELPPPAFITAREDLEEHYADVENDGGYVRKILERMVAEGQYAA